MLFVTKCNKWSRVLKTWAAWLLIYFIVSLEKNEFWQKNLQIHANSWKLFWTLPLTRSRYSYSWKMLYINRYGKRVRERLPSRLHKIYCKEYVLTKFLLPTSLSHEIRLQSPNEHPVVFSLPLETHHRTPLRPKQIQHISGNRGRFSNMSGLSSSTAFNPRESASSIWSHMILLRRQITKTQPFDETESIDVMIANTWNTRLFPKPVESTANTSFSLRRLFIAMSCSFLRWISLEDFEDKNEMLSNRWGLFWQVSNELTNKQFILRKCPYEFKSEWL